MSARRHYVNRSLPDERMDAMDHALGRPSDPLEETYRNHYVADAGDVERLGLSNRVWWKPGSLRSAQLRAYHVTDYGRRALSDYLVEKWEGGR